MKTKLGTRIPKNIRGILYLCKYDRINKKLNVVNEILCESAFDALNYYANIPNPESQLASGKTYKDLIKNLKLLHKNIIDPEWISELEECI